MKKNAYLFKKTVVDPFMDYDIRKNFYFIQIWSSIHLHITNK